MYDFELKKDERASVEITELGYEDRKQNFDFYWTLWDTNKIIIHSKYRKFPRQFVLSLKRNLNWATQTLIPDFKNPHIDRARLILEFSDFKEGMAKFRVYIEDKDSRLQVNFLDPRKLESPLKEPPKSNQTVPMINFNESQVPKPAN
ncbi:exporting protein [Campylobacter sp. MIT 99-7217]|uniref:exporting protein n=1 Tax=Campylobacter sp. MIT 99-7217 TaxID=535091 RepID=UPI00391862DB